MPKISPFEKYPERYEEWFDTNPRVYEAELRAVKSMLPAGKSGLEIGVGTGRFAGPLGIRNGIEPSKRMRELAQGRGIRVLDGVAEELPFSDSEFEFVLMVTTVCFVDDIGKALMESHRVLSDGGLLVIGFIDRNSKMGKIYLERQMENVFYKEATFFSVDELAESMHRTGFTDLTFNQTIFGTLAETSEDEPIKPGYGEGSFVVIGGKKARKNPDSASDATFHREKPESPGWFQRLLLWTAKGAEKSHTGRTSCPT